MKFTILGYMHESALSYEWEEIKIVVKANSEEEALSKAKKISERDVYKIIEIEEE